MDTLATGWTGYHRSDVAALSHESAHNMDVVLVRAWIYSSPGMGTVVKLAKGRTHNMDIGIARAWMHTLTVTNGCAASMDIGVVRA